jgi:hypothetical protein
MSRNGAARVAFGGTGGGGGGGGNVLGTITSLVNSPNLSAC